MLLDMFKPVESFTPKDQMERSARWILGLTAVLIMTGLVMVYSTKTVDMARQGENPLKPLFTHGLKVAIGLTGMLFMMQFDYRALGRHYGKLLIVTLIVLVLVLIPGLGAEVNGARRWFKIFGFMLQPSEFAKLALIITVSCLIIRARERVRTFFQGFLPPLTVITLLCTLILCAPDFGTCVIAGALGVTLLVIGGVRIKYFLVIALVMAPMLFLFAFNNFGHVAGRVKGVLEVKPGSQLHHSLMAFSRGGPLGQGLGGGEWKLYHLPECDSDFIFSIVGEELGFLGTTLVVVCFMAILLHGMRILRGIKNRFGFLMATGVLLHLTTQALVNMAVVVGLAPTKGLPLPFISSGGSSMIALLLGMGLFLNIARNPDLSSEPVGDALFERAMQRIMTPVRLAIAGGNR